MAVKFVYDFEEGNREMKDLLGGKGANLAEMTSMGLPVPHGFTVTSEACNAFRAAGPGWRGGCWTRSRTTGRSSKRGWVGGSATRRIRCWSRCVRGPVLDAGDDGYGAELGLNDQSVEGLGKQTSSERFAWDSYRRLLQMYGKTVMGVEGDLFEEASVRPRTLRASGTMSTWTKVICGGWSRVQGDHPRRRGGGVPPGPDRSAPGRIEAVFGSWDNRRAQDYRRRNKIYDWLGTAVNIQSMVFGNRGDDSGTGVAFTRDPANGDPRGMGIIWSECAG